MIDIQSKPIQDLKKKMDCISEEMKKAKSNSRYLQLKKCYHRLEKELVIYLKYRYNEDIYIYKGNRRIN